MCLSKSNASQATLACANLGADLHLLNEARTAAQFEWQSRGDLHVHAQHEASVVTNTQSRHC